MDKTVAARIRKQNQRKRDTEKMSHSGMSHTDVTGCNAVIPEGVNLFWYTDGARQELKEVPVGCKVLSDGQVWRPNSGGLHG